jgi:hypothetical protein
MSGFRYPLCYLYSPYRQRFMRQIAPAFGRWVMYIFIHIQAHIYALAPRTGVEPVHQP